MSCYVVYAQRTAIGSFMGTLKTIEAHKLGSHLIKDLLAKNIIAPELISQVLIGQVLTAGCGQNPARQASIGGGISNQIPCTTINKVCGSGLNAILLGSCMIQAGYANCVIAGGQENMSLSPHSINLRSGIRMNSATMLDTMITDGLTDAFNNYHMGVTAENIAKKYSITREQQDQFAYASQIKASKAQISGNFNNEIVPLQIQSKKDTIIFDKDEFIKHDTTLDNISKLQARFIPMDGAVTPGNSSGINDGAALTLIMDEATLKECNAQPIARIVSYATTGVDPAIMGIGPVAAVNNALGKAGWKINDLDLIELNEAFAAQSLAVLAELGADQTKVNIHGGAIALGHPIGASGARIVVTLLHAMRANKKKRGLAALCIGGGMGIAMCFELY